MDKTTTSSKYKTTPFKHQLECLERFGDRQAFALLAEMGTGKTWIIINNIAELWRQGNVDTVLVMAPNGVHSNWTRLELPKHMSEDVVWKSASWSSTPTRQEKDELASICEQEGWNQLRILTMNWEALATKKGFAFAESFLKGGALTMIACDESDAIKNPSSQRTKALMKLKPLAKYRRIMSGTPINNAPFDAFAQFSFLDTKILGTTSFYAFKSEYAEMLQPGNQLLTAIFKRSGGKFIPQVVATGVNGRPIYRNLDELSARIAPHSFRVLKSDCLDLPDKIYKTVLFDLTREQREIYKKAEKECRLSFDGEDTPFNKLVAATKLAQITSGYFLHPLAEEPVRIEGDTPKMDILSEWVAKVVASGGKVIVWARYKIEIADIVGRLTKDGHRVVKYYGETSKEDRIAAIDGFENGNVDVFVGNQQAGGTGITLVAANCVIYFSNNFSLRDRLQSEDRAHRIGQTKSVVYLNIAARGTIDEYVVQALSNKKDVAETILNSKIYFNA